MDKQQLQLFKNNDFGEVRTLEENGTPYFVGKDVADILGYANVSKALLDHVDDEDKLNNETLLSLGQRGGWLINESGLYSLILSSKMPKAKQFKRWVMSEVLPSICKHGMYAKDELLDNPDLLIDVLQELKAERNLRNRLQDKIEQDCPKVLFADAVATSKTSILVGELAKLIKQNGVDVGEKRLFEWLRNNKYLISHKGTDYNAPTQKSMDLKLFEVKETAITHSDGHVTVSKTTKVNGKGQQYFVNKFLVS